MRTFSRPFLKNYLENFDVITSTSKITPNYVFTAIFTSKLFIISLIGMSSNHRALNIETAEVCPPDVQFFPMPVN